MFFIKGLRVHNWLSRSGISHPFVVMFLVHARMTYPNQNDMNPVFSYNRIIPFLCKDAFLTLITSKERHNISGILKEISSPGMQLTQPSSIVGRPHPVNDQSAVGVGEPEERQASVFVGGLRRGKGVGDAVGRGPQTGVEGLVGVADQGGVGVGVLHQGGGGRQLQGG